MGWGRVFFTNCEAAFPGPVGGGQATQGLIPDILQEAEKQGMWYKDARGACFKQQLQTQANSHNVLKTRCPCWEEKKNRDFHDPSSKIPHGTYQKPNRPSLSSPVPRPHTLLCSGLLPHLYHSTQTGAPHTLRSKRTKLTFGRMVLAEVLMARPGIGFSCDIF